MNFKLNKILLDCKLQIFLTLPKYFRKKTKVIPHFFIYEGRRYGMTIDINHKKVFKT